MSGAMTEPASGVVLQGVDPPGEFCDRVAELTDEALLARMWDAQESLPSMPELEEHSLWLARMV